MVEMLVYGLPWRLHFRDEHALTKYNTAGEQMIVRGYANASIEREGIGDYPRSEF